LIDSVAATTDKAPTDICLSGNGSFVYNVNEMGGTVGAYRLLPNGKLHAIENAPGLPLSAVGLAAF
jgi:hypothetical protein